MSVGKTKFYAMKLACACIVIIILLMVFLGVLIYVGAKKLIEQNR